MSLLGAAIGLVVVLTAAITLLAIVRFSIISPWITRTSQSDLRHPDTVGTERLVGFTLPPETESFFQSVPFLESFEFVLAAPSGKRWEIGRFYPLTPRHVRENQKVHGIKAVPLAADLDKGVYVLLPGGAIAHQPPGAHAQVVTVCQSLRELAGFKVVG
ncbi:hypothetical protein [Lysobacter tyrosinilyticus]